MHLFFVVVKENVARDIVAYIFIIWSYEQNENVTTTINSSSVVTQLKSNDSKTAHFGW
jgi:hypothetical protein